MVSGVSEERKLEEAKIFNQTNSQTLKKMQDLQNLLKNSQPNNDADDIENDDEFDSYMEEALM